jgi:hypothetical protein
MTKLRAAWPSNIDAPVPPPSILSEGYSRSWTFELAYSADELAAPEFESC